MAEVRTTSSTGGEKGTKLARFDLIPAGPERELAEHYGVGATKYADHNYRRGYEWSKSIAAIRRHQNAFEAGLDYDVCSNDPEGCSHVDTEGRPFVAAREDACFNHTGSHHMVAVAWHAFALLEFKDTHPEFDDRYRPEGDGTLGDGWESIGMVTEDDIFEDAGFKVAWRDPEPPTLRSCRDIVSKFGLIAAQYVIPRRILVGIDQSIPVDESHIRGPHWRP